MPVVYTLTEKGKSFMTRWGAVLDPYEVPQCRTALALMLHDEGLQSLLEPGDLDYLRSEGYIKEE